MSETLINLPMYPVDSELLSDLYRAKLIRTDVIPIGSYHAFGHGADRDCVIDASSSLMKLPAVVNALREVGYTVTQEATGSGSGNDCFVAMRKEQWNLLVTVDEEFAQNSRKAFDVVRALQLTDKAKRILVHKIIVDGLVL